MRTDSTDAAPAAAVCERFVLTAEHLAKRVQQQFAAAGRVAAPVR